MCLPALAVSVISKNDLTRRANQGYDCIIPQFVKTPNALLRSSRFGIIAGNNSPKIEAAPPRHSE
jgi:hypothetical protein